MSMFGCVCQPSINEHDDDILDRYGHYAATLHNAYMVVSHRRRTTEQSNNLAVDGLLQLLTVLRNEMKFYYETL